MWSWMLYGASEGAVEIPEIKTQIIQVLQGWICSNIGETRKNITTFS